MSVGGGWGRKALVAGALALAMSCWPGRASACSVCGCGDPLVLAAEARPGAGWLRLALDTELLTATARSEDRPTATESLTEFTVRPVIVVSPTYWLNLVLQVPVVYKAWSLDEPVGTLQRARPFGLGDLDLAVRWFPVEAINLWKQRRQNFALLAGSSFPTGPNDARVEGERIDQHAQIGTGAFSPYGGLQYAFHQDPWNLFASASYRTHTTNGYGYRFGDALLWTARGEYRGWDWFAFGLGIDGRLAFRDRSNGESQQDTGGLVIALTPGVTLNIVRELWLYVRVQLPVITHLYGEQSVGPVYTTSLTWAFL